ncbi:hypothetical protein MCOR27_003184 [Pyricularia oryzae]|nr:hypothetical protein MCOR01_006633 [Pyricularia oryzae]KAI6255184.1 hypothetical protein MCOR19_008323 [Pyricularia oryzae]KAI6283588.1 hypothetical protein MCOR27_003184 [Pyricularia oryzae]KAI6335022.1 hypothetical protein MCOR28_009834 [Pyricularia oryzae]KAI6380518.1 hypothetical protein MCOR32_004021 [Pyricularia oryzae]
MASMSTEYSKEQVIALAIVFMIFPMIFYGLRVWARLLISRVMLDDYLAGGALSKFAMNMLSILGLGLVKSSILVLYLHLFPNALFKRVVFGMLVYVITWTVSFFFSHLFTCYPITTFIDFFEGKNCVSQTAMFLTVLYTNVIADFAILILPIPLVMRLQLKLKIKIAVIGMLSLGAATCAVSVTRVIAIFGVAQEYTKHPNDIIYYTSPVFYWTNIELSMAVVCACLPTLRPIWTHFYPKKTVTGNTSYELGYGSGRKVLRKNKAKNKTYMELNEGELNAAESSRPEQPFGRNILKETVISQTVEQAGSSSISHLRSAEAGLCPGE